MKQFEVGHRYGEALDFGYSIKVIKRTAQYIKVKNENGIEWRMKIRECEGKNGFQFEYAVDSSPSRKEQNNFIYFSTMEIGVKQNDQ